MSEPELSVILPMFNEAPVLGEAVAEIRRQLDSTGLSYEIVCVNDGSSDETAEALNRMAERDSRLRPMHLSRNFGKEAAMAAGLDQARGKAVLLLDADLQHPPQLIPEMVRNWQRGADVVNGIKQARGREGIFYTLFARIFNGLMGGAAGQSFHGSSDFKLLDRQVVQAVRHCPERHRFFRGLVAWVGFRVVDLPFEVQERAAGTSKWSTRALIRYSIKNLLSFTALPLRMIAVAGFSMLTFTGLLAAWTIYRFVRGDALGGFPTVILLQLIFGSLLLTCLGVVALYLAEMYDELKRRPLYVYRLPDPARDRDYSDTLHDQGVPSSRAFFGRAPSSVPVSFPRSMGTPPSQEVPMDGPTVAGDAAHRSTQPDLSPNRSTVPDGATAPDFSPGAVAVSQRPRDQADDGPTAPSLAPPPPPSPGEASRSDLADEDPTHPGPPPGAPPGPKKE